MYKRPGFFEKLKNNVADRDENTYNDIYDGSLYRELSKHSKILSNTNNISFTWNTDGVSIFKSSKYNIWPFYLTINELPYFERCKLENTLLVGLWFGNKKPKPNIFLKPLQNSMKEIYKGINLQTCNNVQTIKIRGIILCGTCDLPAKALFLNINQFNGAFGCQTCKQEGYSVNHTRVYPYEECIRLRTDEETLQHASQAIECNMKVCGVKGPSLLSKIVHKYVSSTSVDVMHAVFEGVTKKLLNLWLDKTFADKDFSISHLILVIDEKMKAIRPPAFVQRRPRSLEDLSY